MYYVILCPPLWGKEFYLAQSESPQNRASRVVIGVIVALLLGIVSPYLAVIPLVPVLLAFLYAYGGLVPAVLCAALTIGTYAVSFGLTGMLMGFVAYIVPAAFIVRGIRMRLPFFRQIVIAIASLAGGIVAALALAYVALGSNLLGGIDEGMRETLDAVAKVYPGLIDAVMARAYLIPGAPETVTSDLLINGFLTEAQRTGYIDALVSDLQAMLALTLPGYLLSMAAFSGTLAVAWAGYVKRNEPETSEISYVPLARWYTPYQLSLGMLVTLGVGYLLFRQNVSGGDTLYITIRSIIRIVFMIQAAVSLERRLQAFGAKMWLRVVIILLIALLFGDFCVYYGGASALVGSTGAIKQLLEKRANRQ